MPTMISAAVVPPVTPDAGAPPAARWVGLALLLGGEVLLLTLIFDTGVFNRDPRWWAGLMRYASRVPQLGLAVAVATLIFGGRRFRAELGRLSEHRGSPHRARWLLAGHLAAFACFAAITASIGDESVHPTPYGGARMLAWALAGLATAVSWGASVVPHRSRMGIDRWVLGVLAFGTVLGALAWNMGHWTRSFWIPLSRSTFWVVQQLLRLGFRETVCDPERFVVGTSTFSVSIAPQCSGYEGIGLIWTFLAGVLWFFRDRFRFPRAFLLFPIGTAVIWLANAARIAALVAVGTLISPEIAVGGFHSLAGWLSFNLVGLGLIAVAQRCRFFAATGARAEVPPREGPTAAYLMPLLAVVAAGMVTGAFTAGFDRFYPLRVVAAAVVFWCYRGAYGRPRLAWSWEGVGIGVAAFALWMALEPSPASAAGRPTPWGVLTPGLAVAWLIARVLGSVVVVPIAEELAFRGYLLRRVVAADFAAVTPGRLSLAAVAISSAAFGALHGRWLAGTLAGLLYTLAYCRRGRLGDAVLAHATTNALIAADVLAMGAWSLWS